MSKCTKMFNSKSSTKRSLEKIDIDSRACVKTADDALKTRHGEVTSPRQSIDVWRN